MDIREAFQTYYISAFKRYFDFKGRTSRKAYWMFVLFNVIISWTLIAFDNILGTEEVGHITIWGIRNGMFNNFYSLIVMIPGIAIAVRRLHDVGKKGTSMFFLLVPVIGWFIVLMDLIKEGDPVENEYGPVPVDGAEPGGHPYSPNREHNKDSFEVASLRKEAEKVAAKQAEEKKRSKQYKAHQPKKKKNKKKFSLLDRHAVDFTYHAKEKRKT